MKEMFKPLTAKDFEDFQAPVWDGNLLDMDWYVPVPDADLYRFDSYSINWLRCHNDMSDPVVGSYVTIRGAFLAGVLYNITEYRYRFYLAALIYDVMNAMFDSSLKPHDLLYMMNLLRGFGEHAENAVTILCISKFGRRVSDHNWNEMKSMVHGLLTEINPKLYKNICCNRWELHLIKADENLTFQDYLLASLMNEANCSRFLSNDSLSLFLFRTAQTILGKYKDYPTFFFSFRGSTTISNTAMFLVNRLLNRCYACLYSRFSNNTPWFTKEYNIPSTYPEFFFIQNLDPLIKEVIETEATSNPDNFLSVVQGLYQTASGLWRDEMAEIAAAYKDGTYDTTTYIAKFNDLATRASLCSNINMLYKDGMKRLGKKNRMELARLYLKATMACKDFAATKAIDSIAFPDNVSRNRFTGIVADYNRTHDREMAFKRIECLYGPERKKIVIHCENLAERESSQKATATMLNELLQEEETESIAVADSSTAIVESNDSVIAAFIQNNYILSSKEVESLAKQMGTMPSLMIDSVNEKYYEDLDDNLIEQDGDNYIINQDYLNSLQI